MKQLNNDGLTPKFHQLDILSSESIQRLKKFIEEQFGQIDVLVNNAGIAFKVCLVINPLYKIPQN